jgi:hypothetical protein
MNPNWAEENIQVIRTLMERSTVYRRALAPVMTATGIIGIAAATLTCFVKIETAPSFGLFWIGVAAIALVVSFLFVRRQALKSDEPFWSSPTRRVTQALLPGFFIGFVAGVLCVTRFAPESVWMLPLIWAFAYGCAIHAAGFFMPRGMKLFGWSLIALAAISLFGIQSLPDLQTAETAHYLMGTFFGILHLAYGVYLHSSEKGEHDP